MSIAKLYVVRDLVAGEAGPVFTAKNDGIAIRQTCQLLHGCIDVNDYALYQVGTIDTEEMEIQPEIKQISLSSSIPSIRTSSRSLRLVKLLLVR